MFTIHAKNLTYSAQISIRRNADQQLMLNTLIDLKFRVSLQILPYGCFWIIARSPRSVREHVCGHIFDYGIEHYAIAVFAGERSIGLEFCQNMVVGMIAVEADQYTRIVCGNGMHLLDDFGGNAGA